MTDHFHGTAVARALPFDHYDAIVGFFLAPNAPVELLTSLLLYLSNLCSRPPAKPQPYWPALNIPGIFGNFIFASFLPRNPPPPVKLFIILRACAVLLQQIVHFLHGRAAALGDPPPPRAIDDHVIAALSRASSSR